MIINLVKSQNTLLNGNISQEENNLYISQPL